MKHAVLVALSGAMVASPSMSSGDGEISEPSVLIETLNSDAERQAAREIYSALKDDPQVAQLLEAHPDMVLGWGEDFWPDALLRAPLSGNSRWRVHDLRRPQPPLAQGRCEPQVAPDEAVRLTLRDFTGDRHDMWAERDGLILAAGETSNRIMSKRSFDSFRLYLEFRLPVPTHGYGQRRGNSGVFLHGDHEIQILDGWANPTYPDGMIGALYGQSPPSANAALPPGVWQCLDIASTAPEVDESGTVTGPARATVRLNGVLVQNDVAFTGPTAFARRTAYDRPRAPRGPIGLQDHGDPGGRVAFRNIWVIER
ncbi:MAG: DUF1080 domain-containing protein [Erythrobacter sp.]|uniref:3-keto-disaccharide hydrolase n=1 Tax=Erythrobacter sp. TaxID=1042 RepID=UPI002604A12F|nr:DUF1080 domain-containing protein [Erythrobacter sp.]MDJ0978165.1 DUF1080 domain-containing protein [Erythrobacter sp.]